VGSSPSWRTRLISIEIEEILSIFEGFFFLCILKFTHAYSDFNSTLTKPVFSQKINATSSPKVTANNP